MEYDGAVIKYKNFNRYLTIIINRKSKKFPKR